MHKYEEMEYSQIAGVLECSESAVKSLLFRAYETLRASGFRIWLREVGDELSFTIGTNPDLLLDYSAGRLDRARAGFWNGIWNCPACAAFRTEQTALWEALDVWQPEPVSAGFNRRLWRKIEAAAAAPWYRRFADAVRFGAWKPAFPLAAAALLIATGFMFDHHAERITAPASTAVSSGVSVTDAEQVEKTLDDIQLLRQFDAASTPSSGSANAM